MKKAVYFCLLVFVLSLSVFADDGGDMPTGNKNCGQSANCLVQPIDQIEKSTIKTFFDFIFDLLK